MHAINLRLKICQVVKLKMFAAHKDAVLPACLTTTSLRCALTMPGLGLLHMSRASSYTSKGLWKDIRRCDSKMENSSRLKD